MVKQKTSKSSTIPTLYITLGVVSVAVVLILIFALVPMGKKSTQQVVADIIQEQQQAMEKLEKTEESGNNFLIISSVLLAMGLFSGIKDMIFCQSDDSFRQLKLGGYAEKLNNIKKNPFACNPTLTYIICVISLILSILALISQNSGKKAAQKIVTQNEILYLDNNNEQNTEIMKQNEKNLKSFKTHSDWAIALIAGSIVIVITTLTTFKFSKKYDEKAMLAAELVKITTAKDQAKDYIGNSTAYVDKKARQLYNKGKESLKSICGYQTTKEEVVQQNQPLSTKTKTTSSSKEGTLFDGASSSRAN